MCPYSLYQRATCAYHISELNPRLIVKIMRRKFKKKVRKAYAFRAGRHAVYRGAIAHWKNDLAVFRQYRF